MEKEIGAESVFGGDFVKIEDNRGVPAEAERPKEGENSLIKVFKKN